MSNQDHLQPYVGGRGFKGMPTLIDDHKNTIDVYEASTADSPHIWLRIKEIDELEELDDTMTYAIAHLSLNTAKQLAEQLDYLIKHHYQVKND